MTLILSFASHGVAVQVSDRLVSQQRGRKLSPLDQLANKQLIYVARDAIVSIGFAGQAFIGGIPTDEWIAQLLSGKRDVRGPDDMGGVCFGRTPNNWDIGKAVRSIRDELQKHIVAGLSIHVCVVGQQIGRHQLVRPIAYELVLERALVRRFYQSPRRWEPGAACISSIGIEIGDQERQRIMNHIREADPPMTHDQIAEFLTAAIRANVQPGVGPHTSAVIIPFPGRAPVRSKFFPLHAHHILLSGGDRDIALETAYSPWIISPGMIKAPTAEVGGFSYNTSGIEIVSEGAQPPPKGIFSAMGPMPRFVLPPHIRH